MQNQFETKDSGKREQFASGMVRDTQDNKLRYDLAFDGPLFWALNDGTPYERVTRAFQAWYEQGGVANGTKLILALADTHERGLDGLLDDYSALMMRGAVKYDEQNWMKAAGAAEFKRFRSSACRHFKQFLFGYGDEDHRAAVWFNVNGAEYVAAKL